MVVLSPLLRGCASIGQTAGKDLTALNCLLHVGGGGHNNTNINPVFRGMVRFALGRNEF